MNATDMSEPNIRSDMSLTRKGITEYVFLGNGGAQYTREIEDFKEEIYDNGQEHGTNVFVTEYGRDRCKPSRWTDSGLLLGTPTGKGAEEEKRRLLGGGHYKDKKNVPVYLYLPSGKSRYENLSFIAGYLT